MFRTRVKLQPRPRSRSRVAAPPWRADVALNAGRLWNLSAVDALRHRPERSRRGCPPYRSDANPGRQSGLETFSLARFAADDRGFPPIWRRPRMLAGDFPALSAAASDAIFL